MDPLPPQTDELMKNKSTLFTGGSSNAFLWVVAAIAAAFMICLIVDWIAMKRRDRARLERKKRAAAEYAAETRDPH